MIIRGVLALSVLLAAAPGLAASAPLAATPRLSLEDLRAKYADPAGRIATIDGVEVYYKDEGEGPVLLMVHGSESTLKTWDVITLRLKSRYRIIRYDIPPAGLSGRVSDAAAAKLRPVDIPEKLLALLGIKHVTFVGVSSGGTLGVFLAADRPDLVDRLVLSNTPSDPVDTSHMVYPPAFAQELKESAAIKFKSLSFWNQFLSYFSGDPARISAKTREEYYDFGRRGPEKNLLALVAVVANHPKTVDALSQVKAPTLLIWGGSDKLLAPPTAAALERYLTQAQVSKVFMPDVGHYPPLEAPVRFADILSAYIEAATPLAGRTP